MFINQKGCNSISTFDGMAIKYRFLKTLIRKRENITLIDIKTKISKYWEYNNGKTNTTWGVVEGGKPPDPVEEVQMINKLFYCIAVSSTVSNINLKGSNYWLPY